MTTYRRFSKQGISGQGVHVTIVDQRLLFDHIVSKTSWPVMQTLTPDAPIPPCTLPAWSPVACKSIPICPSTRSTDCSTTPAGISREAN
jgi:hypothetical protein